MKIAVLGMGCDRCNNLERLVREVVNELGAQAEIEKVEDLKKIVAMGVLTTPALVINNKVKFSGMVPSKAQLTEAITTELAAEG